MPGCRLEIEQTQNILRCSFHVVRSELLNSSYSIVLAVNGLNEDFIIILASFYLAQISIINRKFLLTVLCISELLNDLMKYFFNHWQQAFVFLPFLSLHIWLITYIYRQKKPVVNDHRSASSNLSLALRYVYVYV